uniref:Uncharacterized protein n=1 Tax=Meloidogyne javanica TaxID=6303 RepID=A0A915MTM0_MELJA
MSRDLYPSNSNIIDLRSKILSTHAPSRTKQFVNELDRLSSSSFGQKDKTNNSGLAYETERWFSPRQNSEVNTSLPPRRSIFTPSRLSARRTRESTKPYWRCPNPTSSKNITPSLDVDGFFNKTTSARNETPVFNASFFNNITSVANTALPVTTSVSASPVVNSLPMNVVPSLTSAAPVDNATCFDVPCVENATEREDAISSGVDISESYPAFTFAEAIIRGPKCPSPPPKPKPTYQDKEIQTDEVQKVQTVNTFKDKQTNDKPFEPKPQQTFDSVPKISGFQPPPAHLNGGFHFGTSTSEATESTMVIDTNINGLTTMNGVPDPTMNGIACAPVVSSFQFSAPLTGVFQFGTSTSEVSSNNSSFCDANGLASRSGVSVRKMLHAKRAKKR